MRVQFIEKVLLFKLDHKNVKDFGKCAFYDVSSRRRQDSSRYLMFPSSSESHPEVFCVPLPWRLHSSYYKSVLPFNLSPKPHFETLNPTHVFQSFHNPRSYPYKNLLRIHVLIFRFILLDVHSSGFIFLKRRIVRIREENKGEGQLGFRRRKWSRGAVGFRRTWTREAIGLISITGERYKRGKKMNKLLFYRYEHSTGKME